MEFIGNFERAKLEPTTQHWAFATTVLQIYSNGKELTNISPDILETNYEEHGWILPLKKDVFMFPISQIILDGWSLPDKKNRFNTPLIFQRLRDTEDDEKHYDHIHSSAASDSDYSSDNESSTNCYSSCSRSLQGQDERLQEQSRANNDLIGFVQPVQYELNVANWKPNSKLIVGELIGKGHYGVVNKGELQHKKEEEKIELQQVAVKIIKNDHNRTPSEFKNFLKEIDIMTVLEIIALRSETDAGI